MIPRHRHSDLTSTGRVFFMSVFQDNFWTQGSHILAGPQVHPCILPVQINGGLLFTFTFTLYLISVV